MEKIINVPIWIDNEAIETGSKLEVFNPGNTEQLVGYSYQAQTQHVDLAVQSSYSAFKSWKNTRLEERIELVHKIVDLLKEEKDMVSPLVARESGMLLKNIEGEFNGSINITLDTIESIKGFFTEVKHESEESIVFLKKEPIGVIVGIVPWNAPIILAIRKIIPAVLTGNTIILKTSPFSTLGTTILLSKIAKLFPPGVVNIVNGDETIGMALNSASLVRSISFTGGGNVAKLIMKDAAKNLKRVQFELGGNDPAIILDDLDFNKYIDRIIDGVFTRAGQVCKAIKRIYVPEKRADEFFEVLYNKMQDYTIGYQLNPESMMGPINNKNQYHFIKGLGDQLQSKSKDVYEVGKCINEEYWSKGYYVKPLIIHNAEHKSDIVSCEQFGPIIPISTYKTIEEAITYANDSEYGLASSIWSENIEKALHVASQIESGMTYINRNEQSTLGRKLVPFAGIKQSGIGVENTVIGLEEYIYYHGIDLFK